jgi:hypothetical protein
MVNHYATLLLNEPGEKIKASNKSYFIAKDFLSFELPRELKKLHTLLFPANTSFYYRQFLCYSYLRLLESTKRDEIVQAFDSRITYDLDKLEEYFRISRISAPVSSSFNYSLLVAGEIDPTHNENYYYDRYEIRQLGFSTKVVIFRETDGMFIKEGVESPELSSNIEIDLVAAPGSSSQTKEVRLGFTGLYFVITGKLNQFSNSKDKTWNFVVEAPMSFNFLQLLTLLDRQSTVLDDFFKYEETAEDQENYKVWKNHFNPVYRFSGLLNSYVNKAHKVWQKQAM